MKVFFFALIFLSSCTMYSVEKTMPDGSSTIVKVKSSRSFEQPDMSYTRTGTDATFDFKAASVDDGTAEIISMFAPIIEGIMSGTIVVTPPTPVGGN